MQPQNQETPDWIGRIEELFFRNGIRGVTMDEVATHLGVSKKTLYQHIPGKDELIRKVLEAHIEERKSLMDSLISKASNAIEELLLVLEMNLRKLDQMKPSIIHDLIKYHHEAWLQIRDFRREYMVEWVEANIRRGRNEGLYRTDFNAAVVSRLHIASTFHVFDAEWFPEDRFDRQEVLVTFMYQFLHSIVSGRGQEVLHQNIRHHE